eukprot:CAMPEP_0174856530 /NCGR_PEP_ID=MMETSP1114-20130205/36085_1 /TAXON_ID=312471 /ORGANISM="Neobodo designis, Strain CCAP 1951/1" /LENGTH=237 /DNA_ID=CAMNT_0016091331 /DNA_START=65 /DNA_END=778 /DNA_ORIENTATION=+
MKVRQNLRRPANVSAKPTHRWPRRRCSEYLFETVIASPGVSQESVDLVPTSKPQHVDDRRHTSERLCGTQFHLPAWCNIAKALGSVDEALRFTAPALCATSAVTPFHSSAVPEIPLHDFLHLLCYQTAYGSAGAAVAVTLMLRAATFGSGFVPFDAFTMHRLLLACVVVGAKAHFDHFILNSHIAKLIEMELAEVNRLEAAVLDALDFRAIPPASEIAGCPTGLMKLLARISGKRSE